MAARKPHPEFKDYIGQSLAIGDTVAFYEPGYRNFTRSIISSFTKQQVRLRSGYLAYPNMFIRIPGVNDKNKEFPCND